MGPRPQLVLVALLVACGPGPVSLDAGAIDTGAGDTASIDVGLDGGPVDSGPEPCTTEGAVECTPDGYAIRACAGGFWGVTDDCMRAHGQLCEAAACVDPWRVGSPAWDTCAAEPRRTAGSLADKAAGYDAIATRLHIHPALRWLAPVHLAPGATESTATVADVDRWESGENDGLWSSLYLASQAYRYAVTRDPESLSTVRTLMDGEAARMRITGVPGLLTRQMIPPGVPGIACPTDLTAYVPDVEKDDNRWVQIRSDGCAWVVDRTTMVWTATTHCGLTEFADWCFLDNVSKDEYAGNVYALGAVWRLVDDVAVRAQAADLLGQIADHLIAHEMAFVDWDGRTTEHGRLFALALDDYPGFNAALALSIFATAAEATGRVDLRAYYEDCLLQSHGRMACIDQPIEAPRNYLEYLGNSGVYVGDLGCLSNFNNISMQFLSLEGLLSFERDPARRELVQASLRGDAWSPPAIPRAAEGQHNAWLDFIWAVSKRLGTGSDGPAIAAVRDGACMLRQFPASYAERAVPLPASAVPFCANRFGDQASEHAREAADRCAATFVWWRDPFSLTDLCAADDPLTIHPPTGYLLPYWLARYHGLISATD